MTEQFQPKRNFDHTSTNSDHDIFFVRYCIKYSVILSVLDPRKCKYLKDYSLDFEHPYMTTYLAS